MRDLKSNIAVAAEIAPAVHSATKSDGSIVDMQGCNSACVVINTGAIVSAGDFAASLVHGDESDLSDSATVEAGDLQGEFAATLAADTAYAVGYLGTKRYVRVVLTKAGGTSIAASAVIVKGNLAQRPAS